MFAFFVEANRTKKSSTLLEREESVRNVQRIVLIEMTNELAPQPNWKQFSGWAINFIGKCSAALHESQMTFLQLSRFHHGNYNSKIANHMHGTHTHIKRNIYSLMLLDIRASGLVTHKSLVHQARISIVVKSLVHFTRRNAQAFGK